MKPVGGLQVERWEDDAAWDAFVASSPHGSTFCHSDVLGGLTGYACERWAVTRKGDPLLALPILLRDGQPAIPPFCYYQGPMIASRIAEMKVFRGIPYVLDSIALLLETLSRHHGSLVLSLHPGFEDIRAIDWFNYHSPGQGRFAIATRYTAILDLVGSPRIDDVMANVRKDRRQDLNAAHQAELRVVPLTDSSHALALYRETLERQGEAAGEDVLTAGRDLCDLAIRSDRGDLLGAVAPDGRILSVQLVLYDRTTAHTVLAASETSSRALGGGTMLCWHVVKEALARGLPAVDFNGANSPLRADYKHSWNAVPVRFHTARWSGT